MEGCHPGCETCSGRRVLQQIWHNESTPDWSTSQLQEAFYHSDKDAGAFICIGDGNTLSHSWAESYINVPRWWWWGCCGNDNEQHCHFLACSATLYLFWLRIIGTLSKWGNQVNMQRIWLIRMAAWSGIGRKSGLWSLLYKKNVNCFPPFFMILNDSLQCQLCPTLQPNSLFGRSHGTFFTYKTPMLKAQAFAVPQCKRKIIISAAALSPQLNPENSTQREECAASKWQEIRIWRVKLNSIMGDTKKETIRLRKGLQNEE